MNTRTERSLDAALESAFRTNQEFLGWFLDRVGLGALDCAYVWSRSDNPWGTVECETVDADTGLRRVVRREGETDILLVVASRTGVRIALHIENKIGSPFTPQQAEMYRERARQWHGNPKYQDYEAWKTVLTAPRRYLEQHASEAMKFDSVISHEDIALLIPTFA